MATRRPSIYIPTLYFAEGLPYTIVTTVSVVFFKTLGCTNEFIGLTTSLLTLPWAFKFLWAPLVDVYSTKRKWILTCQFLLAISIAFLAYATISSQATVIAVIIFALIALASATHDVSIDGFYLDALPKRQQAFYVGVRSAIYKIAMLFGNGGLVYLAGKVGESTSVNTGLSAAFGLCAVIFIILTIFHSYYLPDPPVTRAPKPPNRKDETLCVRMYSTFRRVLSTYIQQPGIIAIVLYILIFRLGDALMLKMALPFLLDPQTKGGLSLSIANVGLIYGTVGTIFLLIGGLLGGYLVAKDGLKKWLLPTAIVQNSAILLYWLLSIVKPGLAWVYVVNSIEQFSYGLGVASYMVFLLGTVKPEFKSAHYAIATALMAFGMILPGMASGYLSDWLGYSNFFLLAFIAAIPGMITIFFLPLSSENNGR